jgi:hypothetical protein
MAWSVLRLLLLGLMLVGLATGLHQQWLVVDWLKLTDDLGLPASDEAEPFDFKRLIIGDQEQD